MRKATISFITIIGSICLLTGCGSKSDSIWPMAIMAEGQIYYCYDEIIEVATEDVEILGYIESTVEMTQGPAEDNQANFTACMEQPYGRLGERMLIYFDDNWHICYPTSEVGESEELEPLAYSIKITSA